MGRQLGLLLALLLVPLMLIGCSANDPLTDDLYTEASYVRLDDTSSGGYWHEQGVGAISAYCTGTRITPNISSLGGYRLDNITEWLYFTAHVGTDWDGVSDGVVSIWFEVNEGNSGGGAADTAEFQLECWHKQEGERTCTVYSLDGETVVGTAEQHDLFKQEIVIGDLREEETLSFQLNLNTIFGDITNVIVNYVEFKYQAPYPAMEVE